MLDAYNSNDEIFTLDEVNFPKMTDFVADLAASHQHIVLGLTQGIKADSSFKTFTDMQGALLMNSKGTVLQNKNILETYIAYADWFSTQTKTEYTKGLVALETIVGAFSGLTLADNTNFGMCAYECYPKTKEETDVLALFTSIEERRARFLSDHAMLKQANPANEE